MSHACDAATGQTIYEGEDVVALVLDRRIGGYPDATTHAAIPGLSPPSLFEPASLPIRAGYGAFGSIVPRKGQASVAQALALANMPDWEAFQEKAFGVRGGVPVGRAAHGVPPRPNENADARRERTFGLAIFRKATWDLAVSASRRRGRKDDVDAVLAAVARVRALSAAGDNNGSMRNSELLFLRQGGFNGLDGAYEDLPELARALARREGGSLLAPVAVEWMSHGRSSPLGYGLLDRDADLGTRRILEAVWDLQAAEAGFGLLGKAWLPSPLTRGYESQADTFALALSMMEESGRAIVARCADDPDHRSGARLAGLLARAEALRATLSAELAQAMSDPEADAGGPRP